jgi:hypothetical protein
MHVVGLLERIRDCAMPNGTIACKGTWLRQKGEMRFAPNRAWMPFTVEQWFPGDGIEFRWQAWIRMAAWLSFPFARSPFARRRALRGNRRAKMNFGPLSTTVDSGGD